MPASDKFWRPLSTMHVVFALTVFALLVSMIWMVADDHQAEWRNYQRTFEDVQATLLRQQLKAEKTTELDDTVKDLEAAKEQAKSQLDPEIEKIQDRVDDGKAVAIVAATKLASAKSTLSAIQSDYNVATRDEIPAVEFKRTEKRLDEFKKHVQELALEDEHARTALKDVESELKAVMQPITDYQKQIDGITANATRLEDTWQQIEPQNAFVALKRDMMEWPIIDGFNSHLKIRQDWLPNLKVNYGGMASVSRYDRCRSCHVAIDQVASGGVPAFPYGHPGSDDPKDWIKENEYPHPFATHPRTDVYLTSTSPHPLPKFGCTVCHAGQGSGTDFTNSSHTPNQPVEAHEWEEEYHFHVNHYWEYPMHPDRFMESSCIKCHHDVVELGINPRYGATAPKVYEGFDLVKKYGCFGCHEINGYDGKQSIGPDLRLEPSTPEEAERYKDDPNLVAGSMRKVGPSLQHVAQKTNQNWLSYWIEEPKRFRPTTRMPQFFKLTNQQDREAALFQPVEITAIAEYLMTKSSPIPLQNPQDGYVPDAERGKKLISERGCLACHSHEDFPEIKAEFGPNLTQVYAKINRNPDDPGFSSWLYTWLKEPSAYHSRTFMPNLFLDPEGEGETLVDPAADITAFLLNKAPVEYKPLAYLPNSLNDLVKEYLGTNLTQAQKDALVEDGAMYPVNDPSQVRGDEIELAGQPVSTHTKLMYIGRKTISRYGCYGCHDIPGFESSRPIGTALQDWGRKDPSMLAFEHIAEYLKEHGESGGSDTRYGLSTEKRAEEAIRMAEAGEFSSHEKEEQELTIAYFYESILHHGRPGFLWQKLRQPRSYDYNTIKAKGYLERLRMPKFPLEERQIDDIATFVLGLVAEPPDDEYIDTPTRREHERRQGELLVDKYNCTGCHMLDLPKITFQVNPDDLVASQLTPSEDPQSLDLLLKLKPPHQAITGDTLPGGDEIISFHGLLMGLPFPEDDPEDQEYAYDLWETLQVNEKQLWPGTRMVVPLTKLKDRKPARGGDFAEFLVENLTKDVTKGNRALAWQMSPPPLYLEGVKAQTPWLYNFLLNPERIRYTTVLRMPRFNMSPEEAQTLANYFAAVDGDTFPYQHIEERDQPYLAAMQQAFETKWPDHGQYLTESWKLLNGQICIKCHSVGGREYGGTNPLTDIHGPNLDMATNRLRPDWLMLWLYKPQWITPYTSMPAPEAPGMFGGDLSAQRVAFRDALMNYQRLMEQIGRLAYEELEPQPEPEAAADAGGQPGGE